MSRLPAFDPFPMIDRKLHEYTTSCGGSVGCRHTMDMADMALFRLPASIAMTRGLDRRLAQLVPSIYAPKHSHPDDWANPNLSWNRTAAYQQSAAACHAFNGIGALSTHFSRTLRHSTQLAALGTLVSNTGNDVMRFMDQCWPNGLPLITEAERELVSARFAAFVATLHSSLATLCEHALALMASPAAMLINLQVAHLLVDSHMAARQARAPFVSAPPAEAYVYRQVMRVMESVAIADIGTHFLSDLAPALQAGFDQPLDSLIVKEALRQWRHVVSTPVQRGAYTVGGQGGGGHVLVHPLFDVVTQPKLIRSRYLDVTDIDALSLLALAVSMSRTLILGFVQEAMLTVTRRLEQLRVVEVKRMTKPCSLSGVAAAVVEGSAIEIITDDLAEVFSLGGRLPLQSGQVHASTYETLLAVMTTAFALLPTQPVARSTVHIPSLRSAPHTAAYGDKFPVCTPYVTARPLPSAAHFAGTAAMNINPSLINLLHLCHCRILTTQARLALAERWCIASLPPPPPSVCATVVGRYPDWLHSGLDEQSVYALAEASASISTPATIESSTTAEASAQVADKLRHMAAIDRAAAREAVVCARLLAAQPTECPARARALPNCPLRRAGQAIKEWLRANPESGAQLPLPVAVQEILLSTEPCLSDGNAMSPSELQQQLSYEEAVERVLIQLLGANILGQGWKMKSVVWQQLAQGFANMGLGDSVHSFRPVPGVTGLWRDLQWVWTKLSALRPLAQGLLNTEVAIGAGSSDTQQLGKDVLLPSIPADTALVRSLCCCPTPDPADLEHRMYLWYSLKYQVATALALASQDTKMWHLVLWQPPLPSPLADCRSADAEQFFFHFLVHSEQLVLRSLFHSVMQAALVVDRKEQQRFRDILALSFKYLPDLAVHVTRSEHAIVTHTQFQIAAHKSHVNAQRLFAELSRERKKQKTVHQAHNELVKRTAEHKHTALVAELELLLLQTHS